MSETEPARSRWPLALIAFLLGSVVTLAACVGVYVAVARSGDRARRQADANARPVYPRPEFSRMVLGKPEAEVIDAVGKPDETSVDDEATYWHYKGRTRDPVSNARDTDVQVVIKDGRVVDINY